MVSDNIGRIVKEGETSVADTLTLPDSTQGRAAAPSRADGTEDDFFKALARYQSSYRCMMRFSHWLPVYVPRV